MSTNTTAPNTKLADKSQLQKLDKITACLDYFAGKISSKEYEQILISDDSDE